MNRLTKKYSYGYLPQYERETKENYYDLVYKLGELEDIEEELGIDLITLFKALINGVYVVCGDIEGAFIDFAESYKLELNIYAKKIMVKDDYSPTLEFKHYGYYWALTKEELNNDKKRVFRK